MRAASRLALSAIAVGCSQGTEPESVADSPFADAGVVRFPPIVQEGPRTREQMLAGIETTQQAQAAVSGALRGVRPDDWKEADRRLRSAIGRLDGDVRAKAEQLASAAMLRVVLPRTEDTPETGQVAEVYTRYLLDRQSPEAELVVAGLDEIGTLWTPEQRRVAASSAVEATTAALSRSSTPGARQVDAEVRGGAALGQSEAAIRRLREMAQEAR